MSKAILVMDMPKTCYKCRLSNRLNPEELILCDGKIVSDTSTIFNLRPDSVSPTGIIGKKETKQIHGITTNRGTVF